MARYTDGQIIKKEAAPDPYWFPSGRPRRREPLRDEFDVDCGISYEHDQVFVRFTKHGVREYECTNCGERTYYDEYSCDPLIHEMKECGRNELEWLVYQGQWHTLPETFIAQSIEKKKKARKAKDEEDVNA